MRFPGFIGPSYTSQSVNVDCQRSVNLYPEIDAMKTGKEGEVASLVSTPGLLLKLTLPKFPVRGLYTASNGSVFGVGGNKFYSISSTWEATELGTLNTDTGPTSMIDNGTDLVLVDGTDGFTWTFGTSTYAEITDPDFYPSDLVTFQDGYFIFTKNDSDQFFISDLDSIIFDPLDIGTAEGSPDYLVGPMSVNQKVFLFGTQSTEVYYNSGDADFPFARIQGAVIDVGCSAVYTIQKLVGEAYWIGGDKDGSGIVYKMTGFQPQRVSTPAIEAVIRSVDPTDLLDARAWTYQQGGHAFYCLNLPGIDTTYVYDASTELWHERSYLNLWSLERHRADCHTVAFGQNIVGDYETGIIYALDQNTYTDNGTSIARIRTAPHLSESLARIFHQSFQLDIETGVGLNGIVQGLNPQAMLRWSDDGGHSWSNEHWADIGRMGARNRRVLWRRLGSSRDRVYEIRITDPVKVVLIGAELNLEKGVA